MWTAYFAVPYTCTSATPLTVEMLWAINVSAYSSTSERGSVADDKARLSTGWSAGFTLLIEGGAGMLAGNCRAACVMAVCTSWAAPSMLRLRLNCRVMLVLPKTFCDDIESSPAIAENCFSRGNATAAAMVSEFAPGREAFTLMVG